MSEATIDDTKRVSTAVARLAVAGYLVVHLGDGRIAVLPATTPVAWLQGLDQLEAAAAALGGSA